MSDEQKNPKPDRAGDGLDDLDVPTYRPGRATSATSGKEEAPSTSIYDRIGRAAPQSIPAKPKQKGADVPPAPSGEETSSFKAASVPERSEPLRSDAPTTAFSRPPKTEAAAAKTTQIPAESSYQDTDFAPTTSGDTVTSSTQPTSESTPQPFDTPTAAGTSGGLYTGSTAVDATTDTPDEIRDKAREGKRGTIDWGILLIRLLLGAYLVLTSVATFFQLGGNAGLAGLESEYAGYVLPNILAILVPSLQLAAGVFLIFGLITPLFAAIATVVTSFTALHALSDSGAGLNIFAWDDSVMLSVILLVISLALQFTGPGLYSFDFSRGWARRPLVSSWIFVVLGIAGAVALWWFGAGVNPLN